MLREGFVQVGVVAGSHGRWGRLRIKSTSDNPARFQPGSVLQIGGTPHTLDAVAVVGQYLVVKLAGIDSPEQARVLVASVVEVPEAEVPPSPDGAYYHFQLLDIQVYDTAGAYLGVLTEVLSTGANDVYVVRGEATELLVPAMDDVVMSVDLEGRRMVVEVPPGLEPRPLPQASRAPKRGRRRVRPKPRPGPRSELKSGP